MTYQEKTRDCEKARADPLGFYHGMIVTHANRRYVMTGPPVAFVPVPEIQPTLFPPASRSRGR